MSTNGSVAQLGERLDGIQEAACSSHVRSTAKNLLKGLVLETQTASLTTGTFSAPGEYG